MSTNLRKCTIAKCDYWFREPTLYDPAKARRFLAKLKVRRPAQREFQVAALAGIEQIAKSAGEVEEGQRQIAVMERWYQIIEPVDENDIDEPDFEKRAEEVKRLDAQRAVDYAEIYSDVAAIEANLERHWQPYAELRADRQYWDDISQIEMVRLLLVKIDSSVLELDEADMLTRASYELVPKSARIALSTFAFGMLGPGETQRKN